MAQHYRDMNKLLIDLANHHSIELWDEFFHRAAMSTVFTLREKERLNGIFKIMNYSPIRIEAFLHALTKSMKKRPRVTRHVLKLILPTKLFPESLHKYSRWKTFGTLIDYLRYVLFGAPKQKFAKQLLSYVQDIDNTESNAFSPRSVSNRSPATSQFFTATENELSIGNSTGSDGSHQYSRQTDKPSTRIERKAASFRHTGTYPKKRKSSSTSAQGNTQSQSQTKQDTFDYIQEFKRTYSAGGDHPYSIKIAMQLWNTIKDQDKIKKQVKACEITKSVDNVIVQNLKAGFNMNKDNFIEIFDQLTSLPKNCAIIKEKLINTLIYIMREMIYIKAKEKNMKLTEKDVNNINNMLTDFGKMAVESSSRGKFIRLLLWNYGTRMSLIRKYMTLLDFIK